MKICDPLKDQMVLKNILIGEVSGVNVDKFMCCMKEGITVCTKCIDERLREKSSSINSTVKRIKLIM